jgi:hypothetical protein
MSRKSKREREIALPVVTVMIDWVVLVQFHNAEAVT